MVFQAKEENGTASIDMKGAAICLKSFFPDVFNLAELLEVNVLGQDLRVMCSRRGQDNVVGKRQFMIHADHAGVRFSQETAITPAFWYNL